MSNYLQKINSCTCLRTNHYIYHNDIIIYNNIVLISLLIWCFLSILINIIISKRSSCYRRVNPESLHLLLHACVIVLCLFLKNRIMLFHLNYKSSSYCRGIYNFLAKALRKIKILRYRKCVYAYTPDLSAQCGNAGNVHHEASYRNAFHVRCTCCRNFRSKIRRPQIDIRKKEWKKPGCIAFPQCVPSRTSFSDASGSNDFIIW